jgi:hypothetical protein
LPDGKRLVAVGSAEGHSRQLFAQDLPDGLPRPISPEGVQIALAVSTDGRFVAGAVGHAYPFRLYPVDGGEWRDIPGATPTDIPVRFSADGAALFVYERQTNSTSRVRIARLDLRTGRRTPWLEFTSPNEHALDVGNVDVTPDGRSYMYCFDRFLSDLYIVDGLR